MPRTRALAALILPSCSSTSGAARLQLATIAATLHASPRASASIYLRRRVQRGRGCRGAEGAKGTEGAEGAEGEKHRGQRAEG